MTEREKKLADALSNLLRAIRGLPPEAFFYLRPIQGEIKEAKNTLNQTLTVNKVA